MTKKLRTNVDVEIHRSPEQVWAVVSDYATDTRWRKGILEMTPDVAGPPRVGTKIREVLRLGGKDYVTNTVVTEAGPDLSYRFSGSGTGGAVEGRRAVRPGPTEDSAIFTYDVEVDPTEVPRLVRPIVGRMLQRGMRRDLARLREMVEAS